MKYTGKIIVLAFPDTFVRMSDEFMCKVLPLLGIGTRTHVKAGHAALVLVENETGNAYYYDFGRYVTPTGNGRVRGANTDAELEIPFKAVISNNKFENLDEFLLWLTAHPEKTHGSGRLVASVCEDINFELAASYIESLQSQGSVPYKAFGNVGSNCSRFVTETILSATDNSSIKRYLAFNKKFTPSTVGNVEKSASSQVYQVMNGVIKEYDSTALRENLTNYFDKNVPESSKQTIVAKNVPEKAQLLTGIGSSAYFMLEKVEGKLLVTRFAENGEQDFQGIALLPEGFTIEDSYKFVHDSNCLYCTLEQSGVTYRLELSRKIDVNSVQKVRSA